MPPASQTQSQASHRPATSLPNVTATGVGIPDQSEQVIELARKMAAEMVGSLDIYEIIAPVGDPRHECWDATIEGRVVHKYNAGIAALEGTFNLHIPEHEVVDPDTKKRVAKVEAHILPMVSGVARTRNRWAAQWAADYFGYAVKKISNEAPLAMV